MGDCCAKMTKNNLIDRDDVYISSIPNYFKATDEQDGENIFYNLSPEEEEFQKESIEIQSPNRIVCVFLLLLQGIRKELKKVSLSEITFR